MNESDAKHWLSDRVSRETMDRLELYHTLLTRWQKTINLIAPSTIDSVWVRHIMDSAQLFDLASKPAHRWLDLGSGGGFPGLVVAAMAKDVCPNLTVTLVESDIRKCGFLREAARQMDLSVKILSRRIGDVPAQTADVISARALSSLSNLIGHARPHMTPKTCLLFPKGMSYVAELETLPDDWQVNAEVIESVTDSDAVILRFRGAHLEGEG
ncbi:16S rRNA (guanine(527)-N(7))-methyltransferase RsmG [Jannaschia sp. CCS1]|uniref:Ribosomal RNA small subunit methyltransferase G n=1 Tax=Jannaschia sp. (strain CCS1) TaxID=290400 RepID=RSMG_JANSC|nr:16S rRNA (guanine(527)-N(7))-methyltransferase RsmG [Jannaschia sp. CCS1]Q28VZ4.1 RecName: Full=Ribosomal RNA small subunit methyltransferase G; AltName: Full=16S rRNA 7-methylguanosine methyltransferase; Short=16S rRNA m7G methyltransferase [Jannaschia sp. CCS1]ABD53118.1 16S rRNA m(7)G-527 methyltransferase [Jannaschia sp. CCS1]